MPAADALTVRTMVTEQLQGQSFRSVIDAFVQDMDDSGMLSNNRPQLTQSGQHWMGSKAFANALSVAETYYLSPDMQALAQLASTADDFPADEVILKEDQPSEAGFMYLPARFRFLELRGRLMIAHAVLWLNGQVWWLCDRRDPEDEMNQYLGQVYPAHGRMPRYDLMMAGSFRFNQPLPAHIRFPQGVLPPDAEVRFSRDAASGTLSLWTDHGMSLEGMTPIVAPAPDLRFLLTVWRLMQQTLADVHRESDHPKPVARYANRARVPLGVTVIQLRRRESHEHGTGQPIDYRTLVRGHWRRVWCGPHDRPEERFRRAVYIHPFIRGPEGAPLIIREKVNALVR